MRSESLLWNFTVLGEAATQLSNDLKDRFPAIAWQQPARLRNRIVHGYWSIDLEILHTTATGQLPAFAASLRAILETLTTEAGQATEATPTAPTDQAPATAPPVDDARESER